MDGLQYTCEVVENNLVDDPRLGYYVNLVFDQRQTNEMWTSLLLFLGQVVEHGHCACSIFHQCLPLQVHKYWMIPTNGKLMNKLTVAQ